MILMKEAPGARFKNYILRVSRVGVERYRLFDSFDLLDRSAATSAPFDP